MKMSDNDIVVKVRQWMAYAADDIRYAEHGLSILPKPPYRLVAYHAQQCVEKYFKAYLVFRNVDFPYTHNISLLLELCSKFGNWTVMLKDSEELSSYAVSVRYPGEDDEVSEEEAIMAINIARKVQLVVREQFIKEGLTESESTLS